MYKFYPVLAALIVKEYNSLLIESVEDGGSESEAHNAAYHVVAQMVVGHV